ncbi:phosphatase PAP2 family protein [Flavisolibacter nicotianae]|uniref:phosphatase PAP2 family protein n=1 Tax=Flavisolibacter nicotianae TaxID=2364882 RepID=UPI000EB4C3C7|nr:phosphatase PAP2 family protein [Flavisolibacter nicotianae]
MFKHISKRVKKTWAAVALFSAEMILVLLVFVIALLSLAYLIRKVIVLQDTGFDQNVFTLLQQHVSKENSDIMLFFTFLGTHKFLIPANLLLIAYFLFVQKHKWYAIKIPAIALSSLALMFGLKHFFNRPRPGVPLLFHAEGLSFPSGHALFSVTFYGLLVYIIYKGIKNKNIKWSLILFLLVLMLVIGFSRVYLRVHYATDVIAGFCVGIIWLVLTIWLLNQIESYSKRQLNPIIEQPGRTQVAKGG